MLTPLSLHLAPPGDIAALKDMPLTELNLYCCGELTGKPATVLRRLNTEKEGYRVRIDGTGEENNFSRGLLKYSGALTSLDISNNNLGAEGAKHIAEAVKVHVSMVVLVPL